MCDQITVDDEFMDQIKKNITFEEVIETPKKKKAKRKVKN